MITLDDAIKVAEAHWRQLGMSEVTVRQYVRSIRRLDDTVGGLLVEPNEEAVRRLERWRTTQQKKLDAETLSRSSVMTDRAAMVSFFDALIARKKWKLNPARQVRSAAPPRGTPRPIPMADLEKLLRQPDTRTLDGLRDRTILELFRHGLRQTEVRHLCTDGVEFDPDHKRVWITFRAKGTRRRRRERDIGLEESGSMLFARYLLERFAPEDWHAWEARVAAKQPKATAFEHRMAALTKLLDKLRGQSVPVFVTSTGSALNERWVNRMFVKYRDLAGLSDEWGPHSLRHRFCTALLEGNVDVRDSMRLTGHEDIRSLMIYTASARSRAASSIDAIGSAVVTGGVL